MTRPLIFALLVLAACGEAGTKGTTALQATAVKGADKISRANAGAPAPAAAFTDKAGRQRTMADFRGRPVLVNLWATWCAPCIAEMPALDRLAGRGATVLAISQDLEGWRAVDRFWRNRFPQLNPYLDRENAWPLALKAQGLPVSILYDAQGREVWRVMGPIEWDQAAPERLATL